MARKLPLILALLAGGLPGWVQALGLGDIELESYLNEPLRAEIPLISASEDDLAVLKINLADPGAFDRAGVSYTIGLRDLRFRVIRKNNQPYIQVTTRESFREPILNFLVEVNWARGRIVREYTLLVDPPTLEPKRRAEVSAPPVASTPSTPQSRVYSAPRAPVDSAPARSASQPASRPTYGGDSYRVRRNDTLWGIANSTRPSDASVEQMMMALLRENPEAFVGNNINRLKSGSVLRIPPQSDVYNLTQRQARAEVRQQYQEWKAGRQARVASQPATTPADGKGKLEILAPRSDDQQASPAASGAGTKDAETAQREASLAREAAEATAQENAELRSRISQLEQQIENMSRIANLKDEQLAAMQQALAELKEQESATAEAAQQAPAEMPVAQAPVDEAVEAPAPEATPAEAPAREVIEATPAAPGPPYNRYTAEGFDPVDLDALAKDEVPAEPFKPVESVTDEASTTDEALTTDQTTAGQPWWQQAWDYIRNNPYIAIAAGLGIGVLLILLLKLLGRGRRKDDFQESILHEPPEPSIDTGSTAAVAGAAVAGGAAAVALSDNEAQQQAVDEQPAAPGEPADLDDDDASSYLSDFAVSSLDSIEGELGEADPLTEADVFMAYGRFQPAEAMIKEAIEKEPQRDDLKLKLLEIYHAARNRDEFEKEAAAFYEGLSDKSDPAWDKVVEMGKDLAPDSSLFSAGGTAAMAAGTAQANDLDTADDFAELDKMTAEIDEAVSGTDESDLLPSQDDTAAAGDLDFDLGEYTPAEQSKDGDNTLELDTDEIDLDFDIAQMDQADSIEDTQGDLDDLANELEDIAGDLGAEGSASDSEESLEFSAEDISSEHTQEVELGDLDFSDASGENTEQIQAPEEPTEVMESSFENMDEVDTKLDLARAYIDMGDPEGARNILDEVLEEGSDKQKGEAQELLGKL